MISWTELIVTNEEGGAYKETLGEFPKVWPSTLRRATVENGRIVEWPGCFICAPGEVPDWDTPKVDVDWAGFDEAFEASR